jgi:hypothetical protein
MQKKILKNFIFVHSELHFIPEMLHVMKIWWLPWERGWDWRHWLDHRISSMEQQKWVTKLLRSNYDIVYKRETENLVVNTLFHLLEQARASHYLHNQMAHSEAHQEKQNNDEDCLEAT